MRVVFCEVDKRIESYYKDIDDKDKQELYMENQSDPENEYGSESEGGMEVSYFIGETGCGLCSLKKLKKAGITHLKVVGRGNSIENMEKDIKSLKKAIAILDNTEISETYEEYIKNKLLDGKCSGQCYY